MADEELLLLDDVVRSLPPLPVNDLLSKRLCPQCILRLFGKYGPIYTHYSKISTILSEVVGHQPNSDDPALKGSANEDGLCSVCYGILQFIYVDENQALVNKGCASDVAGTICEVARNEGFQVDCFSLEVSIPPIIQENDDTVRLYLKEKYSSEDWFQEMLQSESILVKDALKLSITNPLETMLGVKSGPSSFRVRLTYNSSEQPLKNDNGKENNQSSKKRKTGFGNTFRGNKSDFTEAETHLKKCSDSQEEEKSFSLLERKISACCLGVVFHRTPIYIGGRYLKYSRNVSQSRWIIDDERMGEASVEEIVGNGILPLCRGDNYKFHAAGREDIDVRMLGSGRPFLLEIQNPRTLPSESSMKEMEIKINSLEGKLVKVKHLKVVDDQCWNQMREGESEKQKQYAALVWISRPLEDNDLVTISSLKDMKLLQSTPVRVLHRRSPLGREKIIHWMNVEKISGSSQYFLLKLCTQAGTYIKEFVHGDLGRTQPRDDYYIVAVTLPIDFKNDVAVYVYSLRSHQWETYTDTLRVTSPLLFNKYWRGRAGTLVKEILHWPMSGDDKEDSYVFAFDLASEEHAKLMPWPPFHQGQDVEAALCCLDGCLCAWADNAADNVVEMWMMKDYGKSWTKLFRFQTDDHRFCDFFGRNMTGMGLVHTFENELILADFTRDSRNFSNVALKSKCSVSDYVPSLVSLLPIVSDANDKKDDNNLLD